jgi:glycosyltransferase involved in cell wall biosynthesis
LRSTLEGNRLKIFGMSLVKNEADVIAESIADASRWIDTIFVFDNGSTDGTWEIVKDIAIKNDKVIPFKQDDCVFERHLRRDIFMEYKHLASDGDWWCILDSDEFYPSYVREFLEKIPPAYQIVWGAMLQYRLTDVDVARYDSDPSLYSSDVQLKERVRYYINSWSEARFFRYDRNLKWGEKNTLPNLGAVYPRRIPIRHYQHRSPEQLQRRIDVRKMTIASGSTTFNHERNRDANWRQRVHRAEEMDYDRLDGSFEIREDRMPPLPLTARVPPGLVNALRNFKGLVKRKR